MARSAIGKEFESLLLHKVGESISDLVIEEVAGNLKNTIQLQTNFDCLVYFLCFDISKNEKNGWWNFEVNTISFLHKKFPKFVVVFLTSSERGYVIYDYEIDNHTRDFSVCIIRGYYKIKEDYLHSANTRMFRSIDEFVNLLLPYKKE
ncbi:MAG: hypothetical protein KJ706_05710 [Candidatus Omnitrophica bacterium]|nr:hypothetical protein [Candidatus Omnitrophota bacterium]